MSTEDRTYERSSTGQVRKVPCPKCWNPIPIGYVRCGDKDHYHQEVICICGAAWGSSFMFYFVDGEFHVHR